jgi:hypothetical protein
VILIAAAVARSDAINRIEMKFLCIVHFFRFTGDADVLEIVQILFSHKHSSLRLTSLYKSFLINDFMLPLCCKNVKWGSFAILIETFYQKL